MGTGVGNHARQFLQEKTSKTGLPNRANTTALARLHKQNFLPDKGLEATERSDYFVTES
ncbi:MAG: hypothetical protein RMZ69_15280 [Nostoc sp. ChiQUE01a]|nr:hypothetical protein [Nostoc sp. ChiQUE01a]